MRRFSVLRLLVIPCLCAVFGWMTVAHAHLSAQPDVEAADFGSTSSVNAIAVGADGTMYVGGTFTSVDGVTRNRLAAFSSTGMLLPWNPNAGGVVYGLAISGSTVYIAGSFTTMGDGAVTRNRLAAVSATGTGNLRVWNPNAGSSQVNAMAFSGNTLFVGGTFTTIGGASRNRIAQVSASGTGNILPWVQNDLTLSTIVSAIAVGPSAIYVGGNFTSGRNRLAAFSATGSLLTWNPDAGGTVLALAYADSVVYAGGSFTTIGGVARSRAAAVSATGTGNLLPWDPNSGSTVASLSVSGSTVFMGGAFTAVQGKSRTRMVAVNTSGELLSWKPYSRTSVGNTSFGGGPAIIARPDAVYVGKNFTTSVAFGGRSVLRFTTGNRSLSGTVYTDRGSTVMGAGRTVSLSVDGSIADITTTTNSSGQYTFSNIGIGSGSNIAVYLDGATEKAVTTSVFSGSTVTGFDLYQNHLSVRCDPSTFCPIKLSHMTAARGNNDSDIAAIYSGASVLRLAAGKSLFVPAGHTFVPGPEIGVRIGSGVFLQGTLTSTGTIALSGSWVKTASAVFNGSQSTVLLNGLHQSLSGSTTFYNLTKSTTSTGSLTFAATATQTVSNTLTLSGATGGLLFLQSSQNGTQWKIDPQSTRLLGYLDVKDSNNTNATAIETEGLKIRNGGNNTNWTFAAASSSSSSSSSSDSGASDQSGTSGGDSGGRSGGRRGSFENMTKRVDAARVAIINDYHARIDSAKKEESTSASSAPSRVTRSRSSSSAAPPDASQPMLTVRRDRLALELSGTLIVYKDVPVDAWFAPYVSVLLEEEIAKGYSDAEGNPTGEFGVSKPVTYAEVLKMALEAANTPLSVGTARNPSANGTWATTYVKTAEDQLLSLFTPNLNVHSSATRGDVVRIVLEILGYPIGNTPSAFSDVPKNHPASPAIALAAFYGFISGDTDKDGKPLNTFRPNDHINRAEVAKIIALARKVAQ